MPAPTRPTPNGQPFVPSEALAALEGTALFYPHSYQDLQTPVQLFAPVIKDFWFCDRWYFQGNGGHTYAAATDHAPPALDGLPGYELLDITVVGPPASTIEWRDDPLRPGHRYEDIAPCVRTDLYCHIPTGKQFRVHRRRGYSYSAFNSETFTLGIFFYRGDGGGEGGSNTPWLSTLRGKHPRDFIGEVLKRLVNGGLLVTDGSRCGETYRCIDRPDPNFPYAELRRFHCFGLAPDRASPEAMHRAHPFIDPAGRQFECIGYAGERYGPTLIWRVTKPAAPAP